MFRPTSLQESAALALGFCWPVFGSFSYVRYMTSYSVCFKLLLLLFLYVNSPTLLVVPPGLLRVLTCNQREVFVRVGFVSIGFTDTCVFGDVSVVWNQCYLF